MKVMTNGAHTYTTNFKEKLYNGLKCRDRSLLDRMSQGRDGSHTSILFIKVDSGSVSTLYVIVFARAYISNVIIKAFLLEKANNNKYE